METSTTSLYLEIDQETYTNKHILYLKILNLRDVVLSNMIVVRQEHCTVMISSCTTHRRGAIITFYKFAKLFQF